jgi:hypothetical protein
MVRTLTVKTLVAGTLETTMLGGRWTPEFGSGRRHEDLILSWR